MELTRNNRLFFESISHTYLLDDKVLIGVTTLMKKHNLSVDYSKIKKETLEQAAEIGTAIHREIEAFDNGESVIMNDLLTEYKKLGLEHVASEYLVTDNELVASGIDGVYKGHGENTVILVDYKTTTKVHTRALEWQLGLYRVLFERQNPGITVEECFCLHIDKYKRKILGFIHIDPVSEQEIAPFMEGVNLAQYIEDYRHIQEMKSAVKSLETRLKEIDAQILDYMVENGINEMQAGDDGVFKVKKEYVKTIFDAERLKKDLPETYTRFTKTSVVSASLMFKKSKEK